MRRVIYRSLILALTTLALATASVAAEEQEVTVSQMEQCSNGCGGQVDVHDDGSVWCAEEAPPDSGSF